MSDDLERFFHELSINGHSIDIDTVMRYEHEWRCVICGLIAYCNDYEGPLCLSTEFGPLERLRRQHDCGRVRQRQLARLEAERTRLLDEGERLQSLMYDKEDKLIEYEAQAQIRFEQNPISDWLPADAYPPDVLAETIHRFWRETHSSWPTVDEAVTAVADDHRVSATRARQMLAYALDHPGTCLRLRESWEWCVEVDEALHDDLDRRWLNWRKVTARIREIRADKNEKQRQ